MQTWFQYTSTNTIINWKMHQIVYFVRTFNEILNTIFIILGNYYKIYSYQIHFHFQVINPLLISTSSQSTSIRIELESLFTWIQSHLLVILSLFLNKILFKWWN